MDQRSKAVCIIVENLPVPFDRRVWQEARALSEAGYRVSIICPKGRGFERSRETLDGIDIYRHRIWEASGPLGYLIEYGWALAAEFLLALKVYARTRFRVLHACNPPDTIFLIGLFFKVFGVKFIFDHHDLNPELYEAKFGKRGPLYRLVFLAERLTFRPADVSVPTNQSYREDPLPRRCIRAERPQRSSSTADVCVAPDPRSPMHDKSTMNKILECMAYGRPVVLYDLTEGRRSAEGAALYARPNDPADFAEQVLKLLDSDTLRRDLGERGRKRIEERLNWETERKSLLEAYRTVS